MRLNHNCVYYLLFFFISILYPFRLDRVLCKCSASGDIPREFQQPNMIPIMWVLSLSAVLCWLTTDNWTRGFKAFDEGDIFCEGCVSVCLGPRSSDYLGLLFIFFKVSRGLVLFSGCLRNYIQF